jgi:two-component system, NarL family, response regulator NreC
VTIKIVLVDDQEIVRSGLRLLLQSETDMEIVGEAGDEPKALALCHQAGPDVVVLHIEMSGLDGPQITRAIKQQCPSSAILALSVYEDIPHFLELVNAGASGYLPAHVAPSGLVNAIRAVNSGQVCVHPAILQALLESHRQRRQGQPQHSNHDSLTQSEQQVLEMMGQGARNQDIAERLGVHVRTVARYRANMMSKLNLQSRADLVRYAVDRSAVGSGTPIGSRVTTLVPISAPTSSVG